MTTFKTSRAIPAPLEAVFAAFADPVRLERWWGPKDFTNTFGVCEFKPGGRWVFTMHAPDGQSFANESVFEEITAPDKIVIRHVSAPTFRLTVELEATAEGTSVTWNQEFDDAALARKLAPIVEPANEQNLYRLYCLVLDWWAMRGAHQVVKEFIDGYKAWNDATQAEYLRTHDRAAALSATQARYDKLLWRCCLPGFKAQVPSFGAESLHDPAIEKPAATSQTQSWAVYRYERWKDGFKVPGSFEYHLFAHDYRWWLEQVYLHDEKGETPCL